MRAVRYRQFGVPSEVLHLEEVNLPSLGADEVLIRMKLRTINPSDLLMIRGRYPGRVALPAIPGYEGMGTVIEKGGQVQGLRVDERVLALRGIWGYSTSREIYSSGTWQEIVAAKAQDVISVPDEIDDVTAAQLYINPLTAWMMLKYELNLGEGDILIANACGSAMGRILAEFSAILGYEFIGVVRNNVYTETLLKLGVKKVINTSEEPLLETVLSCTKGKGASAALDAVGGREGVNLARCVQENGTMLLYGLLSGEQHPADIREFLRSGVQIRNYWLRNWIHETPLNERLNIFADMIDCFLRNKISLPAGFILDLGEINKAVQIADSSNRMGKILLSG